MENRTPSSDQLRPPRRRGQEGFTLAGLIVILTIISVIIAYTVPQQWSLVMKRERDRQTIFLMKQYARAIREWQRKHQAPPNSLEQLRQARDPRVIRGRDEWALPLTGSEDDWILVPPTAIIAAGAPGAPVPPGAVAGGAPQAPRDPNAPVSPWVSAPPGTATGGPAVPGAAVPPGGVPAVGGSRLNPAASPPDYEGPFIAVRPKMTGPSLIALKGVEDYGEWIYTVQDLEAEIQARQAALAIK